MRLIGSLILLISLLFPPVFHARAQEDNTPKVEITSHKAGEAIRGIVPISGFTALDGLVSWELSFGYASNVLGTWFLIAEGNKPVSDDILVEWDTTTIIDGTYNLRLTVYLEGGRRNHFILPDIRVRNYTPIESDTPTSTLTVTPITVTPRASNTPTVTLAPTTSPIPDTPTPQPTNPIEISPPEITNSLIQGAGIAFIAFLTMGVYTTIRKWFLRT
jgi:hypothetical protein